MDGVGWERGGEAYRSSPAFDGTSFSCHSSPFRPPRFRSDLRALQAGFMGGCYRGLGGLLEVIVDVSSRGDATTFSGRENRWKGWKGVVEWMSSRPGCGGRRGGNAPRRRERERGRTHTCPPLTLIAARII